MEAITFNGQSIVNRQLLTTEPQTLYDYVVSRMSGERPAVRGQGIFTHESGPVTGFVSE